MATVGIDLGTTNTVLSTNKSVVQLSPVGDRTKSVPILPSALAFLP